MSVTFTQVRNTIDLSEKIKIGSGEKVVKTDKIGRSKKIEFTITSKAGKFFAYFDGEKYAGSYKKSADVEKIAKDYLKLVGEEVEVTEREDTASAVARAMKKMGVKYDRKKEDDIISKIPKVLDSMKLSSGAKRMLMRDRDFIADVLGDLNENRAKRDAMKAMGGRRGVDPADIDDTATDDDKKAADKNIMVQLRKVVTLRGMKPVTFDNGKKAKINPRDAEKMLSIYQGLKPASKLQLQKVLSKSPQDFAKAVKQLKENEFFDEDITEAKSATGYEIFHKDYSSAMQHATDFAKKKGQEIDPKEIDNKVATGPKKPSKGKENSFMLKTKKGKSWSVQVYNMGNKYELNMYLTSENDPLKEAVKYTYVAVDAKGKIIGFAGGPKASADAKDMARRNKGVVHKLKKPMATKVGDKEINRPFNPVLKAEVELDEGVIDKVKQVASKKQAMKIDGVMVDTFTASAISQIYDKVNDANKKKMDKLPITKLASLAMKMMQKNEFVPEEVELDESMMSRIHQMVSDGASAKEIADEISKARPKNKVDVKTIEKLIKGMKGDMSESVEKNITFKSFIKQL